MFELNLIKGVFPGLWESLCRVMPNGLRGPNVDRPSHAHTRLLRQRSGLSLQLP